MRLEEVEVWGHPGSFLAGTVPVRGVTVVLGANSTGKTTLLEILEVELESHPYHSSDRSGFRSHDNTFADLTWSFDVADESDVNLLSWCATTATDAPNQLKGLMTDQPDEKALVWAIAEATQRATLEHRDEIGATWDELVAAAESGRLVLRPYGSDYLLSLEGSRELGLAAFARFPQTVFRTVDKALQVPPTVVAPAEVGDVSRQFELAVSRLAREWFGRAMSTDESASVNVMPPINSWLTGRRAGEVAAGVHEIVRYLLAAARELLPPFVAQEGQLNVTVDPDRWAEGTPRTIVGFTRDNGEFVRVEALGSGARRWLGTCVAVAEARLRGWENPTLSTLLDHSNYDLSEIDDELHPEAELVRQQWLFGGLPDDMITTSLQPIVLIDEVELHLHPDAQREAAAWVGELRDAEILHAVVVTTHSMTFLGATDPRTNIALLRRGRSGTQINVVADDILASLEESATSQGLGREAWLLATQAVLVVEGHHDLQVVDRFFRQLLQRHRIRTLQLGGAKAAKNLFESEFLGQSGFPIYVLLDNTDLERVRTAETPDGLTDEERLIWSLSDQSIRHDVTFLSYDEPDIVCSIPLAVLARRYRHLSKKAKVIADEGGYWSELISAWRASIMESGQRTSFKDWAAQEFGMSTSGTMFVQDLINELAADDLPSPALARAMADLFEHLEQSGRLGLIRPSTKGQSA